MENVVGSATKGHKGLGIAASVIMILLGIGVFMAPQFFVSMMIWIFVIGVMIYGVFMIYEYAISDVKNGWNLTSGILAVILGFLLVFAPALSRAETFAFMLAFMTLFSGINQITASSLIKKQGGAGTGWLLAAGIINTILGFFFLFNPYVMLFTFSIIAGIYLIVGGIALFASTMSSHAI
jgi:uncharacterized membrane protein HdeD (DUF308 family)